MSKYFQASLTEQSEAQAFLTMQLINKIGMFSDSQRGNFITKFPICLIVQIFKLFVNLIFSCQEISHVKVSA